MKCQVCSGDKLRREFIPYPASEQCQHPPYICLRCITDKARQDYACPYKGCQSRLSSEMTSIQEFENILKIMFREIDDQSDASFVAVEATDLSKAIHIVRLTGESNAFAFTSAKTVSQLKDEINIVLKIENSKQELIYKGTELKDYSDTTGKPASLAEYGIESGAQIILMVLLYAIPIDLNEVTFDLSWNYPARRKDYLDATCLIFSGTKFKKLVDFSSSYMAPSSAEKLVGIDEKRGRMVSKFHVDESQISIQHTSDKHMDDVARKGKHTIKVYLKRLPTDVTHLFFVLSAWEQPTIAHFPNPSLKFYETSRPSINLCETTFTHALSSSAVIMCSVSRKGDIWQIKRSGALSSGNAKNYAPMRSKIREIIGINHGVAESLNDDDNEAIEIAFSFDTTGSMHRYLEELRRKLRETVTRLTRDIPNIRIALLAHGDYDCQATYVLRTLDFTNNVTKLVDFAMNTPSTRGGGPPECYEWMLHEASRRLTWSDNDQSTKALVVLGDAHPHPPSFTDQRIHWKREVEILRGKGVKIFGVQVGNITENRPFYQMISEYTGGAYIDFGSFQAISDMFLAMCYKCAGEEKFGEFQNEVRRRGSSGSDVMKMLQQIAKAGQTPSGQFFDRWQVKSAWWYPERYDGGTPTYRYDTAMDYWSTKAGSKPWFMRYKEFMHTT